MLAASSQQISFVHLLFLSVASYAMLLSFKFYFLLLSVESRHMSLSVKGEFSLPLLLVGG